MPDSSLTAYSYVTIAIFLLVVLLVIKPVTIRIKKIKLYFNLSTAPPLGVLILLICRAINFDVVGKGFFGYTRYTAMVDPHSILLAYMTGVFQFCAFWVSRKAGNRGLLAFTLFFILTSLMSGLTSNDVVILTGTVFLSYFTKVTGIQPTAFLVSEFTTANIASMALYIGNPTNVIVSEAYNISFITYSAWMLLPTIVTLLMAYLVLRIVFHSEKYLPRHIQPPDADPKSVLIDGQGAIFGLVLLGCCLVTLVATSFASVPVWMVTLPFAIVMLIRDIKHDLGISIRGLLRVKQRQVRSDVSAEPIELDTISSGTLDPKDETESRFKQQKKLKRFLNWFSRRFPTIRAVSLRMPWSILPFSLGMFMLIEALAERGWVGIFATAMAVFAKNYATAVLGMTFVSILACQLLNNLPMTILFTQIIQHPNFTIHVSSDAVMQGFLLGLIVGSNLGACLTLVGSLAGIMFDHILKTKGIYLLGYFQFLKWNLIILPLLAASASAIVIGEIWFIYDR